MKSAIIVILALLNSASAIHINYQLRQSNAKWDDGYTNSKIREDQLAEIKD
jgi:hypothetical protein